MVKSSRLLCLAVAIQQLWLGVSSFSTSLESSSLASNLPSPAASKKEAIYHDAAVRVGTEHVVFMTPGSNDNDKNENAPSTSNRSKSNALVPRLQVEEEVVALASKKQQRALVGIAGLSALATVTLLAKLGVLPGDAYSNIDLLRDVGSTLSTSVLAYVFVKVCTKLASNGTLQPRDSRKIIHTLSAPLFMLTWPIFTPLGGARFFAAVVPFLNAMRLYVASNSNEEEGGQETELANAVSRSGNAKEALGGPFIYVLVLLASVLLFWRDSLAGVVSLSAMAAGDGMADLLGRRYGKNNKWSFSPDKSVAGSAAFVASSTLTAVGLALWLQYTGCLTFDFDFSQLVGRVTGIMATCAAIELLPLGDDNWTVPISAAVLALIFL